VKAAGPERVTAVLLKPTVFPEPPSRYSVTVTIRDGRRFLTQSGSSWPRPAGIPQGCRLRQRPSPDTIISMITVYARTHR
jgi:hypothetical protein